MTIILILVLIVLIAIYAIRTTPVENKSAWHHTFIDLKFSSQEFYQSVEEAIKKRGIPDIRFSRITHSQGGVFGTRREYLRVSRNEYIFDICAAPFGNDFFVSWWMGEAVRSVISKIPILNTIAGKNPKLKSYYQADTEAMFRGSVSLGVQEAIDHMTSIKGIRALSDSDKRFSNSVKV